MSEHGAPERVMRIALVEVTYEQDAPGASLTGGDGCGFQDPDLEVTMMRAVPDWHPLYWFITRHSPELVAARCGWIRASTRATIDGGAVSVSFEDAPHGVIDVKWDAPRDSPTCRDADAVALGFRSADALRACLIIYGHAASTDAYHDLAEVIANRCRRNGAAAPLMLDPSPFTAPPVEIQYIGNRWTVELDFKGGGCPVKRVIDGMSDEDLEELMSRIGKVDVRINSP